MAQASGAVLDMVVVFDTHPPPVAIGGAPVPGPEAVAYDCDGAGTPVTYRWLADVVAAAVVEVS